MTTALAPPAAVPAQVNPTQGETGRARRTTFRWGAVSGATRYRIEVFRVNTGGNRIREYANLTGTSFTIPTGNEIPGDRQFDWCIRAENSAGAGAWSPKVRYRTRLWAPVLGGPANNQTGISRTPTFTWSAASGATSYRFQIATSPSTGSIIDRRVKVTSGLQNKIPSNDRLRANRTYYWRVRSIGPTTSATSEWSRFTTGG